MTTAARETVGEPRVLDLPIARVREHVNDPRHSVGEDGSITLDDDATADHHVRVRAARAEPPAAVHAVASIDLLRAAVWRSLPGSHEVDVRIEPARAALLEPRREQP